MSIYLLFLISLIFIFFLILKIVFLKKSLQNLSKSLDYILKTDTNNLITITSNDKTLKKIISSLNTELKTIRKLKLEYQNESSELKTSITNISHDLRTPLTAIKGYLELIKTNNIPKKEREYLKIINNKTNDLIYLTEELFFFSKSLDLDTKTNQENICLNTILEDTILEFYTLFKKNNITPTLNICSKKVYRLLNKNLLKRILENILSNALKYSMSAFYITLTEDGSIIFKNKTSNLDSSNLKKIFNRYSTLTNAEKSTGIGLSIAKQLTEIMHGKIKYQYLHNYLTITIKF